MSTVGNSKVIGEAEIKVDKQAIKLPLFEGSENEKGIDIAKLRSKTSCVTLDPGFGNTGSCISEITFIDGDKGILRYRGIPIEEIAEQGTFLETAYLLIYGKLPNKKELTDFESDVSEHLDIPDNLKKIFAVYPKDAHPMAVLSSAVCSLSAYYPDSIDAGVEKSDIHIRRLLAKIITIAAYTYRTSKNLPLVAPDPKMGYTENFIHMMFSKNDRKQEIDPAVMRALRMMFILHADHEQNCSTSTVRIVGSSQANIYASISSGICALWGAVAWWSQSGGYRNARGHSQAWG